MLRVFHKISFVCSVLVMMLFRFSVVYVLCFPIKLAAAQLAFSTK